MKVLVTGGGTGIGRAIAAALVAAGDEVVIAGRREAPLKEAAQALGVRYVVGDVTGDPGALLDAGPFDGLVNNAGVARHAPLAAWTAAQWDLHYAVHVRGPAMLCQAFCARLVGPGSVVNVASTLAAKPAVGTGAYAASKAAMVSLTRSMALELAGRGIRCNAVLPGVVPTAMTTGSASGADAAAQLEALRALHPIGRLGAPGDVGGAVAWLLHAEWVTGAELVVDGGLLLG